MTYGASIGGGLVLVLSTFLGSATGQDVLHYKFESGGGTRVINYAAHSGVAPTEGSIVYRGAVVPTLWTAGRFGRALAGDPLGRTPHTQVDTGWPGGFTGSFTFAAFLKTRTPVSSGSNVPFLQGEDFVAVIRGRNANGTLQVIWENSNRNVQSRADVETLANRGWVHVAVVSDAATKFATIYIDGVAEPAQRVSGGTSVQPGVKNLRVGTISNDGSFDIDELRFRLGTATAAEVKQWASETPAADGAFGAGCWPKGRPALLDSNSGANGPPAVGNGRYALELYALPGAAYFLGIGSNRLSFFGAPLPLDLGIVDPSLKGCDLETSADLAWLTGVVGPTGKRVLPLPIPANLALVGVVVYSQSVLYSGALNRYLATNAFASAVGR